RLAQSVSAIVPGASVPALDGGELGVVAPVRELVAERRRRCERPAVVGDEECKAIGRRHRIERRLKLGHDRNGEHLAGGADRLVRTPFEPSVADVLVAELVRVAATRRDVQEQFKRDAGDGAERVRLAVLLDLFFLPRHVTLALAGRNSLHTFGWIALDLA